MDDVIRERDELKRENDGLREERLAICKAVDFQGKGYEPDLAVMIAAMIKTAQDYVLKAKKELQTLRADLATKDAQIAELREQRDQSGRDNEVLTLDKEAAESERDALRAELSALREAGCAGSEYTHVRNVEQLKTENALLLKWIDERDDKIRVATARAEAAEKAKDEFREQLASLVFRASLIEIERDAALAMVETCRKALEEVRFQNCRIQDKTDKALADLPVAGSEKAS